MTAGAFLAADRLTMFHKLTKSIPLLICLTFTASAQIRRDESVALQERARRLEPFITESARRYGVDARVLRILCWMESRYRLDVISPKGARGPMQFMPETARRYGLSDPHDPSTAMDAAARYLRDLLRKFAGRLDLALAAYNAGEGTVDSFRTGRTLILRSGKVINPRGVVTGGVPPYRETLAYVKFGLALFARANPDRLNSSSVLPADDRPVLHSTSHDFTLDALVPTNPTKKKTDAWFIEVQ